MCYIHCPATNFLMSSSVLAAIALISSMLFLENIRLHIDAYEIYLRFVTE
jgi:hypothetical protein